MWFGGSRGARGPAHAPPPVTASGVSAPPTGNPGSATDVNKRGSNYPDYTVLVNPSIMRVVIDHRCL